MRKSFSLWLFAILPFTCQAQDWKLWYNYPAREWEEALPVGNGRMGAMVFGNVDSERISLNEETIWSFEAKPVTATSKTQYLIEKQRELIVAGKYKEADELKLSDIAIPEGSKVHTEVIDGMLGGTA